MDIDSDAECLDELLWYCEGAGLDFVLPGEDWGGLRDATPA